MDYKDLEEHFRTEKKKFFEESGKIRVLKEPYQKENSKKIIRNEFRWILFHDLLDEFVQLPKRIEDSYQKDISFHISNKEKKEYCLGEVKTLKRLYLDTAYANLFSVDNFHNEIFEQEALDKLTNKMLVLNSANIEKWDFSNGLDQEALKNSLEKEKQKMLLVFHILIRTKILKHKLDIFRGKKVDAEPEDINHKNGSLTRNQIVLLLDNLGFIQLIEDNPLSTQAKLIAEITSRNEKNIKKSLEGLNKKNFELSPQEKKDILKVDAFIEKMGLLQSTNKN